MVLSESRAHIDNKVVRDGMAAISARLLFSHVPRSDHLRAALNGVPNYWYLFNSI